MSTDLFSEVLNFPDPDAQQRFAALVGVEEVKQRLVSEALMLLDHQIVITWSERHHGNAIRAVNELATRPPLIILAGDVGTGKTELAETFVDAVARRMHVNGTLYTLSLAARGEGAVGQMSTLIGNAFKIVADESRASNHSGKPSKISVLLVDEGDALAQSRELIQMHHEDRAGVNALIKGIDGLKRHNTPLLVVLCTNRLGALDPAVKRRAAYTVTLQRPNDTQRRLLLSELLDDIALTDNELNHLVALTGPVDGHDFGYTYSDLRQRLVPEAVILGVTYNVPLSYQILTEAVKRVSPTRPFAHKGEGKAI
ncbi:ATP-binding protein [Ktedonobacter sp. SOSP1-52]|uniref:AAA family ATPase n=1 Tax=Ktedonobacter sp. SOSP1-52 TaxID=2778366 RepID=UPI0019168C94|nr:ATP-binding protein [Ktedonobacter sp. SOSP1-52]